VAAGGDLVTGRAPLLANDDATIPFARPSELSPWYRAADGDELVFLVEGEARLESVFGVVEAAPGDYVVVPQGTTHRWVPAPGSSVLALIVASSGHVGPPDRYLSARGQFLEHAPYCERDLHGPTHLEAPADTAEGAGSHEVLVRRQGRLTRYRYAHHPCDVVGWDGCVYPYRLSIDDFAPITGRIHQPPPVHQTFAAPGLVVCSFVPRRLDDHPEAVPAPYNHANTDSDEVLVYVDGDFTSRSGVDLDRGSLTLHPGGLAHGPQPGSVEASLGAEHTDETAVMIDTFAPLDLTDEALSLDDPDYARSWLPEEDQR
jgi:homogentisate 1,2-dioxygenase